MPSFLRVAVVFVLLLVPGKALAGGPFVCKQWCSPAVDATLGYVVPYQAREMGPNGFALPSATAQATANATLDLRLVFGHLVIPLGGAGFHAGLAGKPAPMRDPAGNSVSLTQVMWATLLLPGIGVTTNGISAFVRGAVTSLGESATVSIPRWGSAYAEVFDLGFGVVGDLSTCRELGPSTKVRGCLVLQPAVFENGVTVESGLRVTVW